MTIELKCPFCGEELGGNMAEPCCRNQNCEMNAIPIPRTIWEKLIQAKQDLEIARKALDIANKAIECSERFLLGVQDKKIEMAKATRSSHLLLFQMPAMAALCLNTVRDYKDQIKTITEHKE